MSGRRRFFSEDWATVEGFRLALDPRISATRHRYRGQAWYALDDPMTGKVFRLNAATYAFVARLDGNRTVANVWEDMIEAYGENAQSQDEVISLLGQLSQADFLINDGVRPVLEEVDTRRRERANTLVKRNLMGPMSFRIPLFDPDALLTRITPLFAPLIGRAGLCLWLALVAVACVLAGIHWDTLRDNLPDQIFSIDSIAAYVGIYVVVKLIHELAHGVVAKHFGAPIHEVGIMFLVLFPVPYVDGWATAAFRSKWQRASVALAGIIAETSIAAIAMLAWVILDPGTLRGMAYNAMLVAGISTVLVNANPLLKFDGYFALCDVIESPNLAQRANQYWGRLAETWLFGLEQEAPAKIAPGERGLALLYAPAAFIYRIFLSITIALMVASQYLFLGAVLAIWSLTMSLVVPTAKALWKVFGGARLNPKRCRAVSVTSAGILATLVFVLAVPITSHTLLTGVVWLPDRAAVRAGGDGSVIRLSRKDGAQIAEGTLVAQLEDPGLQTRVDSLSAQLAEAQLRQARYRGIDAVLSQSAEVEVETASTQLAVAQKRVEDLTVTAAAQGTLRYVLPEGDLAQRHLRRGQTIGWVLPARLDTIRVVVPQDAIDRVRANAVAVEVMSASTDASALPAQIILRPEGGGFTLPDPAFALSAGGPIATDPTDPAGLRALERIFVMDVAIPQDALNSAPALRPGSRMYVRIAHDPEPMGAQLIRWARIVLLRELDL